jgi:Zn-finger protein
LFKKEFKEIKQVCSFLSNKECKYWPDPTECHFYNCPLYSFKTSQKEKQAIKKRLNDSVYFSVDIFDSVTIKSTLELIQEARQRHPIHSPSRIYTLVLSIIKRMHCICCGKIISDDDFTTIQDPQGILLYFHSSCESRLSGVSLAREEWLSSRTEHKTTTGKSLSIPPTKQMKELIKFLDGQVAKLKNIIKAPSVPIIKQKKEPTKAPSVPIIKQKKEPTKAPSVLIMKQKKEPTKTPSVLIMKQKKEPAKAPSITKCLLCCSSLSSVKSYSYQSPSGVIIKFCKKCNPKSIIIVTDTNFDSRFITPSRQILIRNQDHGAYLRTQK